MTEALELRIFRKFAPLFGPGEVSTIGIACSVTLDSKDPRLPRLAELEREESDRAGCGFVLSWNIERRYTPSEIENAQLFRLIITRRFEPTGEQCGTQYDTAALCPHCGAGRVQRSTLLLNLRKLPKKGGFSVSLGGEIVVSQEVAERITDAHMTGFKFRPIGHRAGPFSGPLDLKEVPSGRILLAEAAKVGLSASDGEFDVWLNRGQNKSLFDAAMREGGQLEETRGTSAPLPVWHQLVPEGEAAVVAAPTKFGINPLDEDPHVKYRCPNGHTAGLNLLSEVTIDPESWKGRDLCVTNVLAGHHPHDSVLYPEPILLVSPKFRALLERLNSKGVKTEIAHLATGQ